jgi:hypothetical protein
MFIYLSENPYWIMLAQVLVTLALAPLLSLIRFRESAALNALRDIPEAQPELKKQIKSSSVILSTVSAFCLAFAMGVVIVAMKNQTELFNWDNQSGLMILFFLAFIPILSIALKHKQLYSIIARYQQNIRTASLRPHSPIMLLSKPLLTLVALGHIAAIGAIIYFAQVPFDGFAGYANFWGIVLLDAVFITSTIVIFRNNKMTNIKNPEHRYTLKGKMMNLNILIWSFALFNMPLSLWTSSMEIEGLKLFAQSAYLQLMILLMAYFFALPRLNAKHGLHSQNKD